MRRVRDFSLIGLLVVFTGFLYWTVPRHPLVETDVVRTPAYATAQAVPGVITGNGVNLALQPGGMQTKRWRKDDVSVTPDAATSPDGTQTASLMAASQTNSLHRIETSVSGASPGQYHTLSVYAKPVGQSAIQLEMRDATPPGRYGLSICDLEQGVVSTVHGDVINAGLQQLPSGWFRCWAAMPYATDQVVFNFAIVRQREGNSYSGDGKSGLLLWGPQFELGTTVGGYSAGAQKANARQ
jgi:hypothetical protein